MPWAVSFVGTHNAGKTTLLVSLVRELVRRGLRVGYLKSSKEEAADRERPGSDTQRAREAGANPSVFWGGAELLVGLKAPLRDDLSFWSVLWRHFPFCDLVLCEGFRGLRSLPRVLVLGPEEAPPEEAEGLLAVVGRRGARGVPSFRPEEVGPLADLILDLFPPREAQVRLLVDGRPVPLTRFVSRALAGTLAGFVSSLRGVGSPRRLELHLELSED